MTYRTVRIGIVSLVYVIASDLSLYLTCYPICTQLKFMFYFIITILVDDQVCGTYKFTHLVVALLQYTLYNGWLGLDLLKFNLCEHYIKTLDKTQREQLLNKL